MNSNQAHDRPLLAGPFFRLLFAGARGRPVAAPWLFLASAMVAGADVVPVSSAGESPAGGPGRYQRIVERNPFALRPPEPPQPSQPQPVPPASDHGELKLAGASSLDGRARAFIVKEERAKPPRYFSLLAGETEDGLEVVSVDVRGGVVEGRNQGRYFILSFSAQAQAEVEARREEEHFNAEHVRAHELNEQRELKRTEREMAEAERELALRARAASNEQPSPGKP